MKNKQLIFSTTKILDAENRIIEMVGSTETNDRVGDHMFMTGVKLSNYLKNPIVLPNHDYKSPAIGKALSVSVQETKLVFKIQFAETELGKEWFYLYSNKFMNASSIGFNPIQYKPNNKGGFDFIEWELLELSLVTVPCNPEAIQRAYTEGHISKSLYENIKDGGEKMELEKALEKALEKSLKPLTDRIKLLEETKTSDEGQITKSGATLSKSSVQTLTKVVEGLREHCSSLEKFLKDCNGEDQSQDDDEDGKKMFLEKTKDYSEDDVTKMVQEKLKEYLKEE